MIWFYSILYFIISFFFTLVFSKGYDGKGIVEGVRYGFYIGVMMATPMACSSIAINPMRISLTLQWFIYSLIQYLILGVAVAMVFGSKPKGTATT